MIDKIKPLTPNNLPPTLDKVTTSTSALTPSPKASVTQPQKQPADTTPVKKATLTKQAFDPRFGASYTPLEIRFLTGDNADQVLDIGYNVQEFSTAQTAEWEKGKGQTIRVGHNFTNVSPRTFNLTWQYWGLFFSMFNNWLTKLCIACLV